MRTIRDLRIQRDGVTYTGSYEVEDGQVVLMSAHGSGRAKAGKDPKASAEKLLSRVVAQRAT